MRKYLYSIFLTAILSALLSGCSNVPDLPPSDGLSTPSLLSSSPSQFDPFSILHLEGKLEVIQLDGKVTVREIDLAVHSVPINPERPNSAKYLQIIPVGGVRVDDLKGGDHLFRLNLFDRSDSEGEIQIAKIETTVHLERGKNTPINFSESSWDYNFDEDQDTFSNVAELTNGYFKDGDNGKGDNANWVSTPTKVKDPNDHPKSNFILAKEIIGSTSPDEQGNSMLIGDTRSVQAGTKFTLFHRKKSDGTIEKITFYSRLDGSFEVPIKGSGAEDEITLVVASKLQGDETLPPDPVKNDPALGTSITIKYHPIKMTLCGPLPGKDPIAGNGYVILEGEGISSVATQNEVSFPTASGDYVKTTDLKISGQTARTTELTVRIPATAISGFPRVHSKSSQSESVGACPKDQDVVILQNNNSKPDLYITMIDAPFVALLGQVITLDVHLVNQGLQAIENSPFPYYSYISDQTALSTGIDLIDPKNDLEIFPSSLDLSQSKTGEERINSRLDKGGIIHPSAPHNLFFLSKVFSPITRKSYFGQVLFKVIADPILGGVFGGGNNVVEQDEKNNSRAAFHNTFIHSVDLDILKGQKITWNGVILNDLLMPDNKYSTPKDATAQQLKLRFNDSFPIQLGTITNNGTFPMIRVLAVSNPNDGVSDGNDYISSIAASDDNDPLDTQGKLYRNALALYLKKDQAEGEEDLKKPLAVQLIEEARLFNQQAEFPLLVHVYYSEDTKLVTNPAFANLGEKVDQAIECSADGMGNRPCEFCWNRLARKEVNEELSKKLFSVPLFSGAILPGTDGHLFLVAELIQLDPVALAQYKAEQKKIDSGFIFDYCKITDDKVRRRLNLKTDVTPNGESFIPLFDETPVDNVLMVNVSAVAPDLEFVGGSFSLPPTAIINKNFGNIAFGVRNKGTLKADATQVAFYVKTPQGDLPLTKWTVPIPSLDIGPAANLSQSFVYPREEDLMLNGKEYPFGPEVKLVAKLDDPNVVFEASQSSDEGENNNSFETTIKVTAPDLIIYGMGASSCDSTWNCKSVDFTGSFDSSIGDQFGLDIYLKNIGTAEAIKGGYQIKVNSDRQVEGVSCLSGEVVSDAILGVGQLMRISIPVNVLGKAGCRTTNGTAPLSVTVQIEPKDVAFYERALGSDGRATALANNKIGTGSNKSYKIIKTGVDLPKPNTPFPANSDNDGKYFDPQKSGGDLKATIGQPDFEITGFSIDNCLKKDCVAGYESNITLKIKNHGDGGAANVVVRPLLQWNNAGSWEPVIEAHRPFDIKIPKIAKLKEESFTVPLTLGKDEYDPAGKSIYKIEFAIDPMEPGYPKGKIEEAASDGSTADPEGNNGTSLSAEFPIMFVDFGFTDFRTDQKTYKTSAPGQIWFKMNNRGNHVNPLPVYITRTDNGASIDIPNDGKILEAGELPAATGVWPMVTPSVSKEVGSYLFTTAATTTAGAPERKYLKFNLNDTLSPDSNNHAAPLDNSANPVVRVDTDVTLNKITVSMLHNPPYYSLGEKMTLIADCTDLEGDALTFQWSEKSDRYSDSSAQIGCTNFPITTATNTVECKLGVKSGTTKAGNFARVLMKVTCDDIGDIYDGKSVEAKDPIDNSVVPEIGVFW